MDIRAILPFLAGPLAGAAGVGPEAAAGALGLLAKGAVRGDPRAGGGPLAPRPAPSPIPAMDPGPSAAAPAGPLGPGVNIQAPPMQPDPARMRGALDVLGTMPAPEANAARSGPLGRVRDFIESDQGKGALLRAGASMLTSGSVGRGIQAGADYVDQQKAADAATARDQRDYGLRERQVDAGILNDAAGRDIQRQNLQLDAMQLVEAIRKARAGEALTQRQQDILNQYYSGQLANSRHATDVGSADRRYATDVGSADRRYATDVGSADRQRGQNLDFYGGMFGDGTKQTDYTVDEYGTRTGATTTTTPAMRPPLIDNQAAYDALAPGAWYVGRDGVPRQKAQQ